MKRSERKQVKTGGDESHPDPHHNHAADNQRHIDGSVTVSGIIEAQRPPNLTQEHITEREEDTSHEHNKFVVEIITLLVVTVYAFLTLLIYCATNKAANAAKSAADTAKDTLHISQRAYVTAGSPVLDATKTVVNLPVINGGRIPSGKVTSSLYEATFNPIDPHIPLSFGSIVERHHSTIELESIAPGLPVSLTIPVPSLSIDLINKGAQVIMIVGDVEYNDGFPESSTQHYPVCDQTVYHTVAKAFYWVPCQVAVELPNMKTLDWSGLSTTFPPQ